MSKCNLGQIKNVAKKIRERAEQGIFNSASSKDVVKTAKSLEGYADYVQDVIKTLSSLNTDIGVLEKEQEQAVLSTLTITHNKQYVPYQQQGEKLAFTDLFKFKPTGLNLVDYRKIPPSEEEQVLIDGTERVLHKALRGVTLANGSISDYARSLNPALNFLSTKSNNPNVLIAMRVAIDSYISNQYTDLSTPFESDADLAGMLGILPTQHENTTPTYDIPDNLKEMFANGGSIAAVEAPTIGKEITRLLGIVPAKTTNSHEISALHTGFGLIALEMMAKAGYIKTYDVNEAALDAFKNKEGTDTVGGLLGNNTSKFMQKTAKGSFYKNAVILSDRFTVSKLTPIRKNLKILEQATLEFTDTSTPSFDEIPTEHVRIRRGQLVEPTKEHVEAIQILEKIPHEFNEDAMDVLFKVYGENLLGSEVLKKQLEWPDEDSIYSYSKQLSNNGKTRGLKDKVDTLITFYKQAKDEARPFYYKWFVARNNRLHVQNLVANPQADSKIARWVIRKAGEGTTLAYEDIAIAVNSLNQGNHQVENFLYSIVQAFDGIAGIADSEKNSREKIIESARELLSKDPEDLMEWMGTSENLKHPGHAALAVSEIIKYRNAMIEGTTFQSFMLREVDGKTNGFGHKIFQFPVGSQEFIDSMLKAVGIRDVSEEINSVAEAQHKNPSGDVYQKIAFSFHVRFLGRLQKLGNMSHTNNPEAMNEFIDSLTGKDYTFSKDVLESELSVKGNLRGFVKGAATEVMYSSLAYNAGRKRAVEIANSMMDNLSRALSDEGSRQKTMNGVIKLGQLVLGIMEERIDQMKETPAQYAQKQQLKMYKKRLMRLKSVGVHITHKNILSYTNEHKANSDLYAVLGSIGSELYGNPLTEALTEQFGKWEDFNNNVNSAIEFVWSTFQWAYTNEKQKLLDYKKSRGESEYLSKEEERAIAISLIDITPSVETIDTANPLNKVMFTKPSFSIRDELDLNSPKKKGKDVRLLLHKDATKGLTGGPQVELGKRLGGLVESIMQETWGSPGAAALPIATHAQDSGNMVHAIIESGNYFLPVHDAAVFDVGNTDVSQVLNKVFYEDNKQYSMIDALMKTINAARDFTMPKIVDNEQSDSPGKILGPNELGPVLPNEIYDELLKAQKIIHENRDRIFSRDLKVGQFVDFAGTMYEAKGAVITQPKVENTAHLTDETKVSKSATKPASITEPAADWTGVDDIIKVSDTGENTQNNVQLNNPINNERNC